MREFRPPVRPSWVRTALAVVLGLVLVSAAVPVGLVAVESPHATYAMAGGTLVVDSGTWLDGRRAIARANVREARAVTLQGGRRTMGTAMPGYCAGRFSYPEIGAVWQATDCSRDAVLLTTSDGDRPVVVTPPDREAFLRALDAGTDFRVELPPPAASGLGAWLLVGLAGTAIVAAMTVATLLLGPSRMLYRVGGGQFEVRTIFGRRAWPASGLRARGHAARLQLRLAGTAVRGYYTGYYLADGKRTRVYATEPSRGVLIEGPARILVSPDDRDGFLAALRAEGATVEGQYGRPS